MKATNSDAKGLFFCTTLAITDKNKNVYHGRTLEFSTEEIPFFINYFPKDTPFGHAAPDKTSAISYTAKYAMLGVGIPLAGHGDSFSHELCEGVNSAGLSFSLNMKTDSELGSVDAKDYTKTLPFDALGHWALASFATVEEVRQGIANIVLWSRPLVELGGIETPFHFAFYDITGGSIVVEASQGQLHIYDNPTKVMTNSPEFSWHLTNLNNYTHLTNIDTNVGTLGNIALKQPDSGIALALLPSSDTSVDRFVRAVFYSSFVLQVDTPQEAIIELSHIMNKFDRPKNMSIRPETIVPNGTSLPVSEFTNWTTLTDVKNGAMSLRSYHDLNYTTYTLDQFKDYTAPYAVLIK